MIEETAVVVEVQGEFAQVETERRSTCGDCSARTACGTSLLAKVFGAKRTQLWVLNSVSAEPGERVVIGLQEQALLRVSFAAYLVPLLALLVGAIVTQALSSEQSEIFSILGGLAGLVVGLAWLSRFAKSKRNEGAYHVVILSRIPNSSAAFVGVPH